MRLLKHEDIQSSVEGFYTEEETKLKAIFASSPDAITVSDLNGNITDCNQATLDMGGFSSKEEVIGKNALEFIAKKDRERAMENLKKTLEQGSVRNIEYTFLAKDGHEYPAELSASVIKDSSGNLIGFVAVTKDITERKKAQEELQKSEERYRLLFNSGNDAVFVHREMPEGMPGKFVEVNGAACQMLGYTREELLKLSPLNIVAPEDLDVFSKHKENFYAEEGIRFETLLVTKDGRKISVEVTGHLFDLKGQLVVLTIARDITERKRAEEALRDSAKNWSDSFNALEDVMIIINKDYTIEKINDEGLELLGKTREEVIGKKCYQVVHGVDVPCEFCSFKRTLKSGKVESVDRYVELFDKYFSIKSSPIFNERGEIVGFVDLMRDITERKRAEERYRDLVEKERDIIYTLDNKGNITFASPAVETILGYRPEEVVGKNFVVLIPKELQEKTGADFNNLLKTGEITAETVLLDKKGQPHSVEYSSTAIKEGNKVVGTRGIVRDVTERKRAEEALRASEEKYRNLFENARDAIVTFDLKGNVTSTNKAVFAEYGFKEDEFIGKNMLKFVSKKHWPTLLKELAKLARGEPVEGEIEVATPKGKRIADYRSNPIRQGEKVVGFQTVLRDITERKQAEEALRESEERLRQLIEYAPDAIYVNDLKGNFLDGNRQAENLTGYKKDELIGKNFLKIGLLPKRYMPKATKALMKNLLGQKTGPDEFELIRKDGSRVTVEISTFPVKRGGKVEVIGIARDITIRKEMKEKLEEYMEKLEAKVEERTRELREAHEQLLKAERLAAIGEVAAMVGRDLRNPLQSIENTTYYLNNELPRLPPSIPNHKKTMEMLQVLNDSVDYADRIIRDLQDFSATKKPILKKTNINAIIKEAMSQVEAPENVELITELGRLPEIKADKDMIKRTFLNLAINGIQAMENGGRLKVSTKKTKGFVEVSFKDTGAGISKEDMKKLFTPFFTTRAKGMGMGLPICKKFVDAHGGTIEVESEEGKGSTFTVKLPIQQENGGENP